MIVAVNVLLVFMHQYTGNEAGFLGYKEIRGVGFL